MHNCVEFRYLSLLENGEDTTQLVLCRYKVSFSRHEFSYNVRRSSL